MPFENGVKGRAFPGANLAFNSWHELARQPWSLLSSHWQMKNSPTRRMSPREHKNLWLTYDKGRWHMEPRCFLFLHLFLSDFTGEMLSRVDDFSQRTTLIFLTVYFLTATTICRLIVKQFGRKSEWEKSSRKAFFFFFSSSFFAWPGDVHINHNYFSLRRFLWWKFSHWDMPFTT